jgi:predicted ATPase
LRHAVQWSYDLLDDAEKALLDRYSVFAGGFDAESACVVAGSDGADDYVTLDRLDALVRKSLLVTDRSSGRTRYSMLETIRQLAEDQLTASGEADAVGDAHARYFAGREADILALWDSPRQREAYTELADLRAAFRWVADDDDLDTAAARWNAETIGWLIATAATAPSGVHTAAASTVRSARRRAIHHPASSSAANTTIAYSA